MFERRPGPLQSKGRARQGEPEQDGQHPWGEILPWDTQFPAIPGLTTALGP